MINIDISAFSEDCEIINRENFIEIKNIRPINDAMSDSLVFIVSTANNKDELISKTKAVTIICDTIPQDKNLYKDKCLIIATNPKLYFAKIVNKIILKSKVKDIHPTAIIHPNAKIGKDAYIGAYVVIGDSIIGDNAIIYPNVTIYDKVTIGNNVVIDSGAVIGSDGFGFVRDENGVPVNFPQLGGVVIGDNVEIGANACIDKGALQDTIIGNNTKIDNFSQISHNCVIGENNYFMGSKIAGSVTIGDNCWIASSYVINKTTIGSNVTAGIGSVVMNNIKENTTVIGYPSENIESYTKNRVRLKNILKNK